MIEVKKEDNYQDSPEFIEKVSRLIGKITSLPEIDRYRANYMKYSARYNNNEIFIVMHVDEETANELIQKVVSQFDEIISGSFKEGNPDILKFIYKL